MKNYLKQKILSWLRLDKQLNAMQQEIDFLHKIIKDRTNYHLDVHQYKGSQAILIGKYGKRDFVHCYSIRDESLKDLIIHCRELDRDANIGKIDCWPTLSTTIKRELCL